MREGRFGPQEGGCAAFLIIVSKIVLVRNPMIQETASHTAWYSVLISAALAMAVFFCMMLIMNASGGQPLFEAMERIMPQGVTPAYYMLLSVLLLIGAASVLGEFYAMVQVYPLAGQYGQVNAAAMCLATLPIAWMGLEGIVRASKIMAGILVLSFAVVITLSASSFEITRLFPLGGAGIPTTVRYGVSQSIFFVDLLALGVLGRALQGTKYVKKAGVGAAAAAALAGCAMLFAIALLLPDQMLSVVLSPIYRAVNFIETGSFFQRADAGTIFIWLACALLGCGFALYMSANAFCRAAGIEDIRCVLPSACCVMFVLVLLQNMALRPVAAAAKFIRDYAFLAVYIPIIIAALVAWLKKKTREGERL